MNYELLSNFKITLQNIQYYIVSTFLNIIYHTGC